MEDRSKKFLYSYINNFSPTGFEESGQRMWLDYLKPSIDTYVSDTYGSVAGIINPDAPYKVVIEAHADEIAWFVNFITEDGYIYVRRNGGSDALTCDQLGENLGLTAGRDNRRGAALPGKLCCLELGEHAARA